MAIGATSLLIVVRKLVNNFRVKLTNVTEIQFSKVFFFQNPSLSLDMQDIMTLIKKATTLCIAIPIADTVVIAELADNL